MKTPIKFEYDLWTTEDGKCMVRVKATGEVTEVDREVMRLLRAEEKRLRREIQAEQDNGVELSLDVLPDSETGESWLADPHDLANEAQTELLEKELRLSLTPPQLDLYERCIVGAMPLREYARLNRIDYKTAWRRRELIQKKAKIIFG